MPTYPATFFIPPNGRQEKSEVTRIRQATVDYFTEHEVKLSLEQLMTGQHVLYGDFGRRSEDGEPVEAVYIAKDGESCEDSLDGLCAMIKEMKGDTCPDEGCPHYGAPHAHKE